MDIFYAFPPLGMDVQATSSNFNHFIRELR